jgi:putative endonuclease
MDKQYRKMLGGMQAKAKRSRKKVNENWFLYILKCGDGTLYTGIAKDVVRRFKLHSKGKGARYTRTRRPLKLAYTERLKSRTEALVREYTVKHFPKAKKLALIEEFVV